MKQQKVEQNAETPNPFRTAKESSDEATQFIAIQHRIRALESRVNTLAASREVRPVAGEILSATSIDEPITQSPGRTNKEHLEAVGVSPDAANDILRRISQQQFRALELTNLMRNGEPGERRKYAKELQGVNDHKISIRSELGDEQYDQYLAVSGQNNRVRVDAVMADSPAEVNGIQPGDVILHYGNERILEGNDVQMAIRKGSNGGFSNIEILRDGNRMNLMVPNGTLGVQLSGARIDPTK